ncbi:MAG: hypothetical protein R3F49_23520 [Planctomycetota bacterium]
MRSNRSLLLASAGVCIASAASAQTIVISDDFETNTSANYVVVDDLTPDGTQSFAYDYVAAGIPLAPRSTPGTTRGLRLTANDTAGATDAWTLFHTTPVNANHYRLTVDVWMNFIVGPFTTEFAHVGVAGDGLSFNSVFTPINGSGAFIAFTGDGGSSSDYRWFRDPNNTPVGESDSTTLPNSHPSYLGHGSNGSNPFFTSLFPSPPATIAGSPGNIWTTVEIDVDNVAGVISFYLDGQLTFQGDFGNTLYGLVSLGIADVFTSISGALDCFTLYDNLTVETFPSGLGARYCPAVPNSTGQGGAMGASGSDVAADNMVTLSASQLPINSFGFFLTSTTQGNVQQPGGSQGVLCLSGSIGRYVGAGQIKNSGAQGMFDLAIDLTQTPTPTGLVQITGGQTWNFQAWYRDSVGGVATSNFSEGLSITFQ